MAHKPKSVRLLFFLRSMLVVIGHVSHPRFVELFISMTVDEEIFVGQFERSREQTEEGIQNVFVDILREFVSLAEIRLKCAWLRVGGHVPTPIVLLDFIDDTILKSKLATFR